MKKHNWPALENSLNWLKNNKKLKTHKTCIRKFYVVPLYHNNNPITIKTMANTRKTTTKAVKQTINKEKAIDVAISDTKLNIEYKQRQIANMHIELNTLKNTLEMLEIVKEEYE